MYRGRRDESRRGTHECVRPVRLSWLCVAFGDAILTDCILALADDMTGALEVGAKFSAVGIRTLVSAKPVEADSAAVLVLDTETRHRSPQAAGQEVRRFVLRAGLACPRLIYKKTDSTLRGNIAAELKAIADLYPICRAGYPPSYPALGRTSNRALLYVHAVPLP